MLPTPDEQGVGFGRSFTWDVPLLDGYSWAPVEGVERREPGTSIFSGLSAPTIRAQLPKVEVVADPEIEAVFPALQRVVVTIETTDGRHLTRQIDYPKGDPRNPLTDAEVEEKFDALADGVLDAAGRARVKDAVWNLEALGPVVRLTELLAARS